MTNFAANKHFRIIKGLLSFALIFCLGISLAGIVTADSCDDNCRGEINECCECICCPNKILIASIDGVDYMAVNGAFLWAIQNYSHSEEQELFDPIDRPPQNFS